MKLNIALNILLHLSLTKTCSGNINPRILELNDRFLEVQKDGNWLIMFYAPWCAHCRRLEPIWSLVQQSLHNTNIRVCKLDCTSHRNTCSNFRIQTYPTIMFIKGGEGQQFIYSGDRQADDIVHFVLRVVHPTIRILNDHEDLKRLRKDEIIFFAFIGDAEGTLWAYGGAISIGVWSEYISSSVSPDQTSMDIAPAYRIKNSFSEIASKFQQHSYFYRVPKQIAEEHFRDFRSPSVIVHKEGMISAFEENLSESLNESLTRWVNEERFPTFMKITRFNINNLMETNKYLVMAVVEENQIRDIPSHMHEFKNMLESVIKNNRQRFHKTFQFGWIGNPDLANSIAIMKVPLPYLIVLNSSTNHHHIPDDEPHQLTPEAIALFLESVQNQSAKAYGGNGVFVAIYRLHFEIFTSIADMWKGNPVLTSVLFGLPIGFLSLICYSTCCADIMDADEDDFDDDSGHEKKE